MKNWTKLLFVLMSFLPAVSLAESVHTKSLRGASQVKLSKEATRSRADQLGGVDAPDKFTNKLPAGYDQALVLKCLGPAPTTVQNKDLLYGVTSRGDAKVVLLGWYADKSGESVTGYVLGIMKGSECLAKSEVVTLNEEVVDRFDRANFKLTPTESAIAVRTILREGASGGGSSTETLRAYRVVGKEISEIFASPIHFYSDIAGKWNKDGTREHDLTDIKAVLNVESSKSQGIFDWRKTVKKRKSQMFKWNGTRYETQDADPVSDTDE